MIVHYLDKESCVSDDLIHLFFKDQYQTSYWTIDYIFDLLKSGGIVSSTLYPSALPINYKHPSTPEVVTKDDGFGIIINLYYKFT